MTIKVEGVLYKPFTVSNMILVEGIQFPEIIHSPNVFVIDTPDMIEDNSDINFECKGYIYELKNVKIRKIKGKRNVLETEDWKIELKNKN